jgi:hypothetical protein
VVGLNVQRAQVQRTENLVRTIHGFDALLVLTGSTASANL